MIPDAAVEAAAKFLAMKSDEDWSGDQWTNEKIHDSFRAGWREQARELLEAAAPHMAAQALTDAVYAFPLETITAPDNAVVWMMRRAEQLRPAP